MQEAIFVPGEWIKDAYYGANPTNSTRANGSPNPGTGRFQYSSRLRPPLEGGVVSSRPDVHSDGR